ncbi:MAG TPA: DMT family transporter [Caulobacteraceae bacterium]
MARSSDSPLTPTEWGAIWLVVVVWGVNNAAGKFATAALPPLFVGGVRFAVALVLLFPFIKPPFPAWKSFLPVVLIMGPIHFGLVYTGFALAHNLSLFSVSLQLWIPLAALFSWLILGEAAPRSALFGMALAFAGVGFMTLDPRAAADVDAVLVGLVASCFWALGTVLVRRLQPTPALKVQGCCSLVAAPVLLAAAFTTEPHLVQQAQAASPLVWASLIYAGAVSSVLATVALFWLVQRRQAGRFAPYLLTTPLVSAVLGVAFFGDVITGRLLAGAAATLGGVAVVALAERRGGAPARA